MRRVRLTPAMRLLQRCRSAENELKRIDQRIQQRRDAMQGLTACYGATGGGGSGEDRMAAFVAAVDELAAARREREDQLRAELAAACVLFDRLNGLESGVLYSYYADRQSVPLIACRMGYTDGYIRRVKIEAEQQLGEIGADEVRACLPAWYLKARPLYAND